MSLPLTIDVVAQRLENYAHDNYLQIGSINKGVALAAATFVGLSLIGHPEKRPRLTAWFASFMTITVSYMAWGRGVILTNARSNLGDSLFPLAMGLIEFSLFAVLWSDETTKHSTLWRNWFLVSAAQSGLAALLIGNRIDNTYIAEDFEPALRRVAEYYMASMYSNRRTVVVFAVVSFVIWIILTVLWHYRSNLADRLYYVAAVLMGVALILPMVEENRQRQEMDRMVSELKRTPPSSSIQQKPPTPSKK